MNDNVRTPLGETYDQIATQLAEYIAIRINEANSDDSLEDQINAALRVGEVIAAHGEGTNALLEYIYEQKGMVEKVSKEHAELQKEVGDLKVRLCKAHEIVPKKSPAIYSVRSLEELREHYLIKAERCRQAVVAITDLETKHE
jgi:hypothetical protein